MIAQFLIKKMSNLPKEEMLGYDGLHGIARPEVVCVETFYFVSDAYGL
jgi:hypothetical protein